MVAAPAGWLIRARDLGQFCPRSPATKETRMRAISLDEALEIIDGTFASAKKRKAYAAERHPARRRRPGEGVPQAGRLLAAALRDRLRQGLRGARRSIAPRARCCRRPRRSRPSCSRSPSCRTARCSWKPAASSSATTPARVVGALGVTGDVNEVDDLCAIDGIRAGRLSLPTTISTPRRSSGSTSRRTRRCATRASANANWEVRIPPAGIELPHICLALALSGHQSCRDRAAGSGP